MSKRGPKRTPTVILRQRGSWLAGTRQNEPKLPVEAPDLPPTLQGEGKAEWERVVPRLLVAGVLTAVDRAILRCYCDAWAEYNELEEFCRKDGKVLPMIETTAGNWVQNPAWGLRNKLRHQVHELAACLGITPADRSSVKAAPKAEPEDAKKRFFKGA